MRHVESTALLIELTDLGQGVAVLPEWACTTARREGRIATPRLGKTGLSGCLWACAREAEADLPHIEGFLEAALSC